MKWTCRVFYRVVCWVYGHDHVVRMSAGHAISRRCQRCGKVRP